MKWTSPNRVRYTIPATISAEMFETLFKEQLQNTEDVFLHQGVGRKKAAKYLKKATKKLGKKKVRLIDDTDFKGRQSATGLYRGLSTIKSVLWDRRRARSIIDIPPGELRHFRTAVQMVKFSGGKKYWRQWAAYWAVPFKGSVNPVLLHEFNHMWGRRVGHSQSLESKLKKKFGEIE